MGWTFHLTDWKSDGLLADITPIVGSKEGQATTLQPRLNRPCTGSFDMPADSPLVQTLHSDGDPYLYPGSRAIKCYQDGTLRAHLLVWTCVWSGDANSKFRVQVTATDPMARTAYRYFYLADGTIADIQWDPTFATPIDAGTLIKNAINNSASGTIGDDLVVNGVTPAIFPIDTTTGLFNTTADLSAVLNGGPQTIADIITLITDGGAADVVLVPVDSSMGYAAGIMAQLNVVRAWGSDRSGTVHFDYDSGAFNCSAASRTLDASTLGNRITYELGPKQGKDHWAGNITATEPALASYLNAQLASRQKFGVYHQVRTYDSDSEDSARPLFHQLWRTESTLRVGPRQLLSLTPVAPGAGIAAAFRPYVDFGLGDLVAVNVSNVLGPPLANAKQRIYGFDLQIDENGVEQVTKLVTSADETAIGGSFTS